MNYPQFVGQYKKDDYGIKIQGVRKIKYIFLSYSSENIDAAEKLYNVLKNQGFSVWMAKHSIGIGEDFSSTIQNSIENCSCFVLLLTKEAQTSPWIPKELDMAISYKKPIVPVQLKQEALVGGFKFNLINTQIFTLPTISESNEKTQYLIAAIQAYLNPESNMVPPPKSSTPAKKKFILPIIAVVLIIAILASLLIFKQFSGNVAEDSNTSSSSEVSSTTDTESKESATTNIDSTSEEKEEVSNPADWSDIFSGLLGGSLPEPSPTETNQIPEYFEKNVTALKYADDLSIANMTETVKVGEYVSLPTAWQNTIIYSENTDIAVGKDGILVEGVSPGTTYVVLAVSKNMAEAYRIIVVE